jgi:diamine N-acetyltransferase
MARHPCFLYSGNARPATTFMTTLTQPHVKLRPLERSDLHFVHQINNNSNIMRYWFEEPYEAYVELVQLYDRHIHDQSERRFIIENDAADLVGLVELVEINYIHRRAEFQIIIAPAWQGKGYAGRATQLAVEYAFSVLNLYKLYLLVDTENHKAIRIYEKCGFRHEGKLTGEFFVNGVYRDAFRMCIFQHAYLAMRSNEAEQA